MGNDLAQLFLSHAGNLDATDERVEQGAVVPHDAGVGLGGLLLAARNCQFGVIPNGDEQAVVRAETIVVRGVIQQGCRYLTVGLYGLFLGQHLGRDLDHFDQTFLGGVFGQQSVGIHVHAGREHAGLQKQG